MAIAPANSNPTDSAGDRETRPKAERLFLGVPVTGSARRIIAASLPRALPGKPVIPENWHFTVRFLGATEAERRDHLIARLSAGSLGSPFTIAFGELGAFPNPRRARILWLGVGKGEERFRVLGTVVEQIVIASGFEPEKRQFSPHLTISRIDPPRSVASLVSAPGVEGDKNTGKRNETNARGEMRVESVVLYRSVMGGGAPRYQGVVSFPLAG